MTPATRKLKIQKRLGVIRDRHGKGHCWVCGSGSGVKTAREAYGTRCKRCLEEGKTVPDVIEYDRLKATLDRLNGVALSA
jgi:hypothetical protein